MKRFRAAIVVLALILCSGCGGPKSTTATPPDKNELAWCRGSKWALAIRAHPTPLGFTDEKWASALNRCAIIGAPKLADEVSEYRREMKARGLGIECSQICMEAQEEVRFHNTLGVQSPRPTPAPPFVHLLGSVSQELPPPPAAEPKATLWLLVVPPPQAANLDLPDPEAPLFKWPRRRAFQIRAECLKYIIAEQRLNDGAHYQEFAQRQAKRNGQKWSLERERRFTDAQECVSADDPRRKTPR